MLLGIAVASVLSSAPHGSVAVLPVDSPICKRRSVGDFVVGRLVDERGKGLRGLIGFDRGAVADATLRRSDVGAAVETDENGYFSFRLDKLSKGAVYWVDVTLHASPMEPVRLNLAIGAPSCLLIQIFGGNGADAGVAK